MAPLVEEMLAATEGEMSRYERIITYWPTYGPDLEKAVTGALREATMGVSRQCGLMQTKDGPPAPPPAGALAMQPYYMQRPPASASPASDYSPAPRGGRTAWRWVSAGDRVMVPATFRGAPACLQQGINPNQALLLNSLRRLLAVSPQLEHLLNRWCGGVMIQSTAFPPTAGAARGAGTRAFGLGASLLFLPAPVP